jgi:hypothetical protein
MNPILESILVVAGAICVALVICSLIGAVWFAIQPTHEADQNWDRQAPAWPLDNDREFTDPDTNPVHRVNPVHSNSAPLTAPPTITFIGMTTPTATHPDRL